ncbi:MAG TPA: hypothetical protein VFR18_12625 [Terriglobia bacterium]|nr:hypothetical protein [Terriglobia bacterium]
MIRNILLVTLFIGVGGVSMRSSPQSESELETFFRGVTLSTDQISEIRSGKPVAKVLESRKPDEIFVLGAVFIRATPEAYVKFANDIERLRQLSEYQAVGVFSNPPQVSDLEGLSLDKEDIDSLKDCKPTDCEIQMPAGSMGDLQKSINWSAPNVSEQLNQALHRTMVERLTAYHKSGNLALGEYNDKDDPTVVSRQFKDLLSFAKAMPKYTPDLHRYLLEYPAGKPAAVEEMVRWEKVTFGLKPTVRVVHVITVRSSTPGEPAYVVAGKQLYASHYFETALDLAFCVRSTDPQRPGFYLIMVMGSEQDGLSGLKGSIVRRVVVGRTASSLEQTLTSIKSALEGGVSR